MNQNKEKTTKIVSSKDNIANADYNCPYCRDTGKEYLQANELQRIDPIKYSYLIEWHLSVYKDINTESQGYPIQCRFCNGKTIDMSRAFAIKERANIPHSFNNNSIDDFDYDKYYDESGKKIDMSQYKDIIHSFINDFEKWENEGEGLYIFSKTKGSGKTFLASCICNSLIKVNPISTRFVSASKLLDIAQNSDNSGDYSRDPLSLLCKCKVLCIDDLGQKNCGSNFMNDVLFKIIDSRYQNKLITIYTSNQPLTEIDLDDRIADRIYNTVIPIKLPECCIRANETTKKRQDFIKSLGISK